MFVIEGAASPWSFGWTQLLTLIGFAITIAVALGGFRTFDRWKREKIEERKIEIAFDLLEISYESKYVFEAIRSPMTLGYEYKDMPRLPNESDFDYDRRGPYYAVLKRLEQHNDFFVRFFKLQPRCMAIFGEKTGDLFLLLHQARRSIEVSAQMLCSDHDLPQTLMEQMRRDIWDHKEFEAEKDEVGKKLKDFRSKVESICRPIVTKIYGKQPKTSLQTDPRPR